MPPVKTTEIDCFALFSKRNNQTISGCAVDSNSPQMKLSFVVEGKYYPRFNLRQATHELKEKSEDLEIYLLTANGSSKVFLGNIPLSAALADDFVQSSDDEEEEEPDTTTVKNGNAETPDVILLKSEDGEVKKEDSESGPEEDDGDEDDEDDDEEVYLEPKLPEREKQRLLAQQELAQGDSSISSDDGEQDKYDEQLSAKYDKPSSQEEEDDDDSDVVVESADLEQKIFNSAPMKFQITIVSGMCYEVELSKDMEHKCFKLERIEIQLDADQRLAIQKKKKKVVLDKSRKKITV